jgi:dihydrofolate reductase
MRKVMESTLVSLDGGIGDPMVWANEYFDEEAVATSLAQLRVSDAILLGHNPYEMFAAAWPSATGDYADAMNAITRYVFSGTLAEATWTNTTIVGGDVPTAVRELKEHGDGDLVLYGHGPLGQALLDNGLLDELRLWIHPPVRGIWQPAVAAGRERAAAACWHRGAPTASSSSPTSRRGEGPMSDPTRRKGREDRRCRTTASGPSREGGC